MFTTFWLSFQSTMFATFWLSFQSTINFRQLMLLTVPRLRIANSTLHELKRKTNVKPNYGRNMRNLKWNVSIVTNKVIKNIYLEGIHFIKNMFFLSPDSCNFVLQAAVLIYVGTQNSFSWLNFDHSNYPDSWLVFLDHNLNLKQNSLTINLIFAGSHCLIKRSL